MCKKFVYWVLRILNPNENQKASFPPKIKDEFEIAADSIMKDYQPLKWKLKW